MHQALVWYNGMMDPESSSFTCELVKDRSDLSIPEVKEDTARGCLRAFFCPRPAAPLFRRLLGASGVCLVWWHGSCVFIICLRK